MKKNKGFTLVELLAVLVILSILVAFSTISVGKIKEKQEEKNRLNVISSILTGAKRYVAENPINDEVSVEFLRNNNFADFDKTKYLDIYDTGFVINEKCPSNTAQRKFVFKLNGTKKYNDCGCESQTSGDSNTLCIE